MSHIIIDPGKDEILVNSFITLPAHNKIFEKVCLTARTKINIASSLFTALQRCTCPHGYVIQPDRSSAETKQTIRLT